MRAQDEILKKYGPPGPPYQAKWCGTWDVKSDFPWFPASHIFINKDFKDKLYSAFKELESKGLQNEIKTFDGCYAYRTVRGTSHLISLHSWAMAIDLNASAEKLGQETTHFTDEFIKTMKKYVYWGGNFSRPDPMHFALYNG